MNKIFIAIALAATLALGACSAGQSVKVEETISEVQATTARLCRFVPTVDVVARVLASFVGGVGYVDIATTAAQGICDAIAAAPLAEGKPGVHAIYRGVEIQGRFVR